MGGVGESPVIHYAHATFATLLAIGAALSLSASAAVTKVDITERTDLPVAGVERIQAIVHYALDPDNAANKIIVDLDKAPRNAQGMVEFAADLRILRMKDPKKRNGTMIVEAANRGHISLPEIGVPGKTNPMRTAKDVGDPWLLQEGFTLAWVGWEFDMKPDPDLIKLLNVPVLRGITGPVRAQVQVDAKTTTSSLADRGLAAYVVADIKGGSMTVRDGYDGTRQTIPRGDWHFTAAGTGVEYPRASSLDVYMRWCTPRKIPWSLASEWPPSAITFPTRRSRAK